MPERILSERYQLIDVVGRGGMAVVWRAVDRTLGRQVAVKVLHAPMAADPRALARFRREATASASVTHPGMVAMYDVGADGDDHFLVMELLDGENLAARLGRDGRLGVDEAAAVGASVADALAALHRVGLVHRDVKPSNIMLTDDGRVKLMDLGIVQGQHHTALTAAASVIGTAAYLSPEQAQGLRATPASDIYGLGCVLFHITTGRPPFDGDTPVAMAMQHVQAPVPTPSQTVPGLPAWFDEIVRRALSKNPDERFADAAQLAGALRSRRSPAAAPAAGPDETATAPVVAPTAVAPAVGSATESMPVAARDEADDRRSGLSPIAVFAAVALIAGALMAGIWWASTQDDTPIGSVVTQPTEPGAPDDGAPDGPGDEPDPDAPDDTVPDDTEPDETEPPTETTEPDEPPAGVSEDLDAAVADLSAEADAALAEGEIDQSARDNFVAKATDAASKAREGDDDALDQVQSLRDDLASIADELSPSTQQQLRRTIDALERAVTQAL